jgi:Xaa-Pro aminopeptidase
MPGEDMRLEPPVYLAFEECVNARDVGSVLIEENVILTESGLELLTKANVKQY